MKPLQSLVAAGALVFPILGLARGEATQTTRCYAAHFVRFVPSINLSELRQSVLYFNNGDLENAAVVERLTVRDAFGTVLHDSGPKIGVPHPLNTAVSPPLDFTTVPPGATYAFATANLWGSNDVPGGFAAGSGLSVTVEVSKTGRPRLFVVHGRDNARERVPGPALGVIIQGAERSASAVQCFRVGEGED